MELGESILEWMPPESCTEWCTRTQLGENWNRTMVSTVERRNNAAVCLRRLDWLRLVGKAKGNVSCTERGFAVARRWTFALSPTTLNFVSCPFACLGYQAFFDRFVTECLLHCFGQESVCCRSRPVILRFSCFGTRAVDVRSRGN
jgi:hypothetical protein